ncbi:MAG TPA: glycosyltransferase family 39 protein [Lysobacter sp.]
MNPTRLLSSVPRSLLVAAFVAFAFMAMRVVTVGSPIMASDEYAYFGTAKFAGEVGSIFQFDPGMQAVGNRVYPLLYRGWALVGHGDTASVGRLFNSLLFVLGTFILFNIFMKVFDRRSALLAAILYLLMPLSFYAVTLLPEVEFQVSVYLVALVVALAGPRPSYARIAVAAALSALAYFIKPHAAALIGATGLYFVATAWLQREEPRSRRLVLSIGRGACYWGLSALLIVLVSKLVPVGSASGGEVVSSFYRSYVDRIFDVSFITANLAGLADYVGGHLWLLLALFAPGVCFVVISGCRLLLSALRSASPDAQAEVPASAYFALYVLLLLLAFLVMISVFTSTAGMLSDFEKYRLHGRYLAPVLPLLLGCSVWAVGQRQGRMAAVLGLVALVTFVLFGRGLYKVFPWDYPDAFGLFGPSLRYWGFAGALEWTAWAILLAGIVGYLALALNRRPRAGYVAFVVVVALASHAQMWRWVDFHVESNRPAVAAADAIESYLGDAPTGSGLVLTLDRYGQAPYLLMGLDHPQFVRTTTKGSTLSALELPPGIRWVVAPQSAQLVVPGASESVFGDQRLYLLEAQESAK